MQALHWGNYTTSKTQKSAAGRHSSNDKGTRKKKKQKTKNFFGDALGCIHARELIRSAIERAIDRALARSEKRWGPGVAVMGAGGRVWTKSRGTKQAIFLGIWDLTSVAFPGAGIRVFIGLVYQGKPDIVFRFIIERVA